MLTHGLFSPKKIPEKRLGEIPPIPMEDIVDGKGEKFNGIAGGYFGQ